MSGVQMSNCVSKIGRLDPRCYSLIYCAIPGVQMSGVQMSGVQMSGVQMSDSPANLARHMSFHGRKLQLKNKFRNEEIYPRSLRIFFGRS